MSDKIQKLQELIKAVNDGLTREEFLTAFKGVIDYVKQIEPNLDKKLIEKIQTAEDSLSETDQLYQDTIKKIEGDTTVSLAIIKKQALEEVNKLFTQSKLNEKIKELDTKLSELKGYKFPDLPTIVQEAAKRAQEALLPLIPKDDEKKDEMEEQLEIKSIKDLQETIDELKKMIQTKNTVHALGTSGGGRIVKSYDISSQLNGVLTAFSLPAMWRIVGVFSSSFPNTLEQTTDWVYSATAHTITFQSSINPATTLAAGQTITIIYSE